MTEKIISEDIEFENPNNPSVPQEEGRKAQTIVGDFFLSIEEHGIYRRTAAIRLVKRDRLSPQVQAPPMLPENSGDLDIEADRRDGVRALWAAVDVGELEEKGGVVVGRSLGKRYKGTIAMLEEIPDQDKRKDIGQMTPEDRQELQFLLGEVYTKDHLPKTEVPEAFRIEYSDKTERFLAEKRPIKVRCTLVEIGEKVIQKSTTLTVYRR